MVTLGRRKKDDIIHAYSESWCLDFSCYYPYSGEKLLELLYYILSSINYD